MKLGICRNFKATKAQSSLCQSTVSPVISLFASDEKNIEMSYFSNFKAKSNLRQCTDSSEPSLIAELRNNINCYLSNFEAQSNSGQCTDSSESSLIAEMRNNMEISYFSNFEAQSSL